MNTAQGADIFKVLLENYLEFNKSNIQGVQGRKVTNHPNGIVKSTFTIGHDKGYAAGGGPAFMLDIIFEYGHNEIDARPFASPDPVGLHDAHLFGPLLQEIQVVEQPLSVFGDPEEPLG